MSNYVSDVTNIVFRALDEEVNSHRLRILDALNSALKNGDTAITYDLPRVFTNKSPLSLKDTQLYIYGNLLDKLSQTRDLSVKYKVGAEGNTFLIVTKEISLDDNMRKKLTDIIKNHL